MLRRLNLEPRAALHLDGASAAMRSKTRWKRSDIWKAWLDRSAPDAR
jgi:hypothetical protein